ncbi:MAG: nickel-dependent hydrogenase large subunit, partial [Planctomycetes bacterium]|nr:nickel-dependent hydrogenase large subunit [Planctomycetota bacterium]
SVASAAALRDLAGTDMPRNAYFAHNIMLAVETILSHLTHFYLSFAPDLADPSADDEAARRFAFPGGRSATEALRAREEILGVLGLFAGKWPNTLAIQPGGTTRPVDASEIRRARGLLSEFAEFIEHQVIGCEAGRWLALASAADLDRWLGEADHAASDVGVFVALGIERGLDRLGTWPARFISSGGYVGPDGRTLMRPGFHDGRPAGFDPAEIAEHVRYSWYDPAEGGVHPFDGESDPAPERPEAYSWAKAPRYAGRPAEAGPLARMVNDSSPLITDLVARHGPSALVREIARLHETVVLADRIGRWLAEVDPTEPFYRETPLPASGCGVGLVEAPRGTLGHWLRVEGGRIRNYQIVTPTGWNLSPRDSADLPGPLESALVGTPVPDPDRPVAMAHVVKSFDPCLFCTVH